jgi:hypothetical protein
MEQMQHHFILAEQSFPPAQVEQCGICRSHRLPFNFMVLKSCKTLVIFSL